MKPIKLFLLLLLLPLFSANAQKVWDGTVAASFAGGTGTANDPYLISNASQLAYLFQETKQGNDFDGKYLALTNDIIFNRNAPAGGTFSGTLDGRAYRIHALNCERSVSYECGAIFTSLNGTIKNLGLTRTTKGRWGIVKTINESGRLVNCFFTGRLDRWDRYDCYSSRYAFATMNYGTI